MLPYTELYGLDLYKQCRSVYRVLQENRGYPNALPCIHLIEPASHKRLIFDALENMTKFDLIEFPDYDGKDVITIVNADGSYQDYELSFPERLALVQCNLAKTEITYMRKYISANGQTSYDLAKDKKNTMHDDRASNAWANAA